MSDDRSKSYNLRSKRVTSGGATEGFVRASELLRRRDEERGDSVIHQATNSDEEQVPSGQELVSDVPPNNDDEGGSINAVAEPSQVEAVGDQRLPDSPREAQGQSHPPTHSPVAQQDTEDQRQEVLRLRVQVRNTKTHKVEYVWIPINMLI